MGKMNRYEYIAMMREKQHTEQKEERLNGKSESGYRDSVPQEAVNNIIEASR